MKDMVKNCPSCGVALVFMPEAGTLKCPSCGCEVKGEKAAADAAGEEKDLLALLGGEELNEEAEEITIKCPSCGAETALPANQVAGFCRYCKSPIVASSRARKSIRPQGILPFAVTEEDARAAFRKWRDGLWFAPNRLKDAQVLDRLEGFYTPVWTFDFKTCTSYVGSRGVDYTVREKGSDGKMRSRTKTRWHYVTGTVDDIFDDILVYARSNDSQELMETLAPWDVTSSQNYHEDIVRGFVEESYDVPIRTGLSEARNKADSVIEQSIRRDIGGDRQRILSKSVSYSDLTYKLLLLPFWVTRYTYGGKEYLYVVNGRSGKMNGQRPWSGWKLTFFILFLVAVGCALFLFFSNN